MEWARAMTVDKWVRVSKAVLMGSRFKMRGVEGTLAEEGGVFCRERGGFSAKVIKY